MRFVELVSKIVIVPAALLYFSGWIYLYTLCTYVGLDVSLLDLDTNTIIMNSYNVLNYANRTFWETVQDYWIVSFLVVVVIGGTILIPIVRRSVKQACTSRSFRYSRILLRRNWIVQGVVFVLIALVLSNFSEAAARNYLAQLPSKPGARMFFDFSKSFIDQSESNCKVNPACYYEYLKSANDSSSLRMLLETSQYFVVWAEHLDQPTSETGAPASAGKGSMSIGEVYLIKKENVNLAGAADVETCLLGRREQCAHNTQ